MKNQTALTYLIILIGLLSLIAAGVGVFSPSTGQPYEFQTLRGETAMINGRGLYYFDTVSSAAQQRGQDVVTLVLTLPVLVISTWLAFRGSLKGKLLLSGTLGYFLYTYMMMSFQTAYNPFFLIYVALFSLSLYAFVLSMMSFDLEELPRHFSARLPRRGIAVFLFVAGGFLLLAWLGRIVPPLLQNQAPVGIESTTTLVIQAMDLGLLVPLTFLSAVLLLRRSPWGYLLASVSLMKFLTYGIAVSAMGINMVLSGIESSPVELVVFPALALSNLVMAFLLLKNVDDRGPSARNVDQV